MILRLLVACFFVGSAIFFAEVARANKWVSGERARKLIHIMVGLWGAWLPWWLGYKSIIVLGVLLIIGVYISNQAKWFKSIHSVSRNTIGEYLFPVSMIVLAILFKNQVIFAAGMLQMGISDGMAAVIGTRYGRKTSFRIIGNKKSIHGTATFFACSVTILFLALIALKGGISALTNLEILLLFGWSLVLSVATTIAELTGKYGLDNVTVPLLTAVGLTLLA